MGHTNGTAVDHYILSEEDSGDSGDESVEVVEDEAGGILVRYL